MIGLCLVGLIMVYSAPYADGCCSTTHQSAPSLRSSRCRACWPGAVLLVVFMVGALSLLAALLGAGHGRTLLMLVLVLFAPEAISPEINGAHRWLH